MDKWKIRQGDVYWVKKDIDTNSHVQSGDRPYVVVSKSNNLNMVQMCPMTKDMSEYPYHASVFCKHSAMVMCNQIVSVDAKKLNRDSYYGHLYTGDLNNVLYHVLRLFGVYR